MSIELPQKNTVIAMSNDSIRLNIKNDTVQRGTSMYVSITVNSKQYKAIFDIGASTTFMSEAFAKKTGVRLIADSLQIHGGITVYGQSGTTAPCKRAFENGNDRPATHRPKGKK